LLLIVVVVVGAVWATLYFTGRSRGPLGFIKVKTVLDNTARFDGKTVRVSGVATKPMGMFGQGIYHLSDGTGEILIVTSRAVPSEGEQLTVRGRVSTAFVFGTQKLVAIIETQPNAPSQE